MTTESDWGRKLRHKERRVYVDEFSDDEIEGKRTFNLDTKLESPNYNAKFVREMKPEDFTMKYVQQNGLTEPIIFYDKTGLGMRIPSENFKVSDVKHCVGSRRVLDVMDVNTQKGLNMTMKEWCQYYENKDRDRLLNVISLEFSHTRLDNYAECPKLVRDLDWVDCVWPKHLKECQTESTNAIDKMKYPKVQKYCLMSVAGCYTDFHMDFGGTSVWYHVLHGSKIFWMIPPTEDNIHLYEQWILSGKQGDIFFADQVRECQRIKLEAGYTFIIPTGWIHGVFTPDDSLVFGGNFIHSFNMVKQLQIVDIEDRTHVPHKFRYPFFGEMCWYVLERYVSCIMGKSQLTKADADESALQETDGEKSPSPPSDVTEKTASAVLKRNNSVDYNSEPPELSPPHSPIYEEHSYMSPKSPRSPASMDKVPQLAEAYVELKQLSDSEKKMYMNDHSDGPPKPSPAPQSVVLTKWEREGLQAILDKVIELPINKKCIPKDLSDPDALIRDVKTLLADHADDDHAKAVTGTSIIAVPEQEPKLKLKSVYSTSKKPRLPKGATKKTATGVRHRRTRCKACEACTRSDCGECHYCKDMRKYGGPGRMKQSCVCRQCMRPCLPNIAACLVCNKDLNEDDDGNLDDTLMECRICWEIHHPRCLREKNPALTSEGIVNEDLPNSWECPKCCDEGLQGQLKPRVIKGLGKRTESRQASVDSESSVSSHQSSEVKMETTETDGAAEAGTSKDEATLPEKSNKAGKSDDQEPRTKKKDLKTEVNKTVEKTNSKQTNGHVTKPGDSPTAQENRKPGGDSKTKTDNVRSAENGRRAGSGKLSESKTKRERSKSDERTGRNGKDSPRNVKESPRNVKESPRNVKESPRQAGRKRKENGKGDAPVAKRQIKEETPQKQKETVRKSSRTTPPDTSPSLAAGRPKREVVRPSRFLRYM